MAIKEHTGGSVDGHSGVKPTIQHWQPEKSSSKYLADSPMDSAAERIERPLQLCSQATDDTGASNGKMPEKVPVRRLREPHEIVRPLMHWPHEGRVRVDKSVRAQHPIDLIDYFLRTKYVLKHGLYKYSVNRTVKQRDLMTVRDKLTVLTAINIECYEINIFIPVERLDAAADLSSTNNEETSPTAARFRGYISGKSLRVILCHLVAAGRKPRSEPSELSSTAQPRQQCLHHCR
jgi:hypothetical protein